MPQWKKAILQSSPRQCPDMIWIWIEIRHGWKITQFDDFPSEPPFSLGISQPRPWPRSQWKQPMIRRDERSVLWVAEKTERCGDGSRSGTGKANEHGWNGEWPSTIYGHDNRCFIDDDFPLQCSNGKGRAQWGVEILQCFINWGWNGVKK